MQDERDDHADHEELALSFRPTVPIQRLSPGSKSATIVMARLRPRVVRFQDPSAAKGLAILTKIKLQGNGAKERNIKTRRVGLV